MSRKCRQRGFTLIELIIFIVIVSVALVGVLTVFNVTTKSSADPMIRKQALAIAEAILEEVMLQPFTWCDPDDRNAANAQSAAVLDADVTKCWDHGEGIGVETVSGNTDTRPSNTSPFDNVSDYHGLTATTFSIAGASMPPGYSASVTVGNTSAAAGNRLGGITVDDAVLLIIVTVTHGADSIVLEGYRTRHSPNMLP